MKDRELMTLEEIKDLHDDELLQWYKKEIEQLCADKISEEVINRHYGKSIYTIYMQIEYEYQKYRSEILFSGELIQMYPGINVRKAKKSITCDFSGGIINPGSLYVSYRPLLKNIENGETYILSRTIKVELGYEQDIPQNIQELESLYIKAQAERDDASHIDYNHFMAEMGWEISFQKLKRRKKNENRTCK